MPYIPNSTYRPSPIFHNGHISTIYSGILRKFGSPKYDREKLLLPDGDFLLLDSQIRHPKRAVILCHGLEGDSRKNYINICANFFLEKNYSVFAWNNRSCGGQMNSLPQLYHHASIEDFEVVIKHVIKQGFSEVFLIGFSLGGDQILNYLGKKKAPESVKAAVAISAPFQLKSSAIKLQTGLSKIYHRRFIGKVRAKIAAKAIQFPEVVPADAAQHIKNFDDVVSRFIIPVHGGYSDLADYYLNASPGNSVSGIQLPILVINAWDDPILGTMDHPIEMAKAHNYLFLETPDHGGHCAFPPKDASHPYSIERAYDFFREMT
jgi:predicted alpha/beta-fold hydrolase